MAEAREVVGYYYLHENGDLIFKTNHDGVVADLRESDFVRAFWPINPADREGAWNLLVEALTAGAKPERVMELARKWACSDTDAHEYASRIGVKLQLDGTAWHATAPGHINVQESPNGFGATCLEALAALAKELGYHPSKMWGASFKDLLQALEVRGG